MLITDNVDVDHYIERNINYLLPFVKQFNLDERSQYAIHINGELLVLVLTFVTKNQFDI